MPGSTLRMGVALLASGWLASQVCAGSLPPAGDQPFSPLDLLRPVAVFGADERADMPEQYSALEGKIGMLYEQSTQTLCTAFCVGKGIIATAAHCLFQPKNNKLPDLNEVTFRLSYGNAYQTSGISGRHTNFTKNSIAVGTTAFNNEPPLSAPKDWALAKLERPICRFGVLKVESPSIQDLISKSKEKKIFQVAYHWDWKHWQLAYSTPCKISRDFDQIKWRFIRQHFVDDKQLVLHDCDTGGASSGSPLLLETGSADGPSAVGINVGTYTRTRILLREGRIVKRMKPDIIANTGVNGSAFGPVIESLENADLLASAEEMMKLQGELQLRGLYTGLLDGQLGRDTRSAILRFEESQRLVQTGLPTRALLRRMDEDGIKASHTLSTIRGGVTEPRPNSTPRPIPLNKNEKLFRSD
jgi:Putative peptidoglycan binding domain/Trypsin